MYLIRNSELFQIVCFSINQKEVFSRNLSCRLHIKLFILLYKSLSTYFRPSLFFSMAMQFATIRLRSLVHGVVGLFRLVLSICSLHESDFCLHLLRVSVSCTCYAYLNSSLAIRSIIFTQFCLQPSLLLILSLRVIPTIDVSEYLS